MGTWHAGAKSNDYESINSLSKKNVYKLKNRISLKIKVALSGNNKEKTWKNTLTKDVSIASKLKKCREKKSKQRQISQLKSNKELLTFFFNSEGEN